jgi:hypothetical protein
MSATPENPPAFPLYNAFPGLTQYGMTLRDWFAGQAKISTHLIKQTLKANGENHASVTLERLFEVRADLKFKEADAMLRERARTKGTP